MIEFDSEISNINWKFEDYTYFHNFKVHPKGIFADRLIYYKNELLKNPEFLFKFYNKSDNSLNAMLKNYVYFSNPRYFNDPFDCLTNREKLDSADLQSVLTHLYLQVC